MVRPKPSSTIERNGRRLLCDKVVVRITAFDWRHIRARTPPGFLITAYLTDAIKEGDKIWPN